MDHPFHTVALIGKHRAPEIARPLLNLAEFLANKGLEVVVDQLTAEYLNQASYVHVEPVEYRVMALEEMCDRVDLGIVVGGDGTLLNIASMFAPHGIPLVGINQGRLGFLTDISVSTMKEAVEEILGGKYIVDDRLLLSARLLRDGREIGRAVAFNDVVIHRDNANNMIEFGVRINGEYVYNQRADGLIVSTPTGSTAYALSCGGSIIHSGLECIQLVPVCPHTLSNRPIVVRADSLIEISVHTRQTSYSRVRFDSHANFDLADKDVLEVSRHDATVRLLHPVGYSYYHTLREKLFWNKSL